MSAAEIQSYFKNNVGVCGCGCGLEGVLRAKPWRDQSRCVKRGCTCRRCRGLRNKRKGARGQVAAMRALGVPASTIHPGHEELVQGLAVRWEHKTGHQSSPVITRYRLSKAQSEAQRARGDNRPFVATFAHDGTQVAVVDLTELAAVVWALAEQWSEGL